MSNITTVVVVVVVVVVVKPERFFCGFCRISFFSNSDILQKKKEMSEKYMILFINIDIIVVV